MLTLFTPQELVIAAAAALGLTLFVLALNRLFRSLFTRSTEFSYTPTTEDSVLEKCCSLFPTEYLRFNDMVLKRGMRVRVSTYRDKLFEGEFIGVNSDNMICVMTGSRVVAQELDMVEEIEQL